MGALFSFLGGSAFRMIWGEVSHWLSAKQEHQHEIERLQAQERIDAAAHARNLQAMKLQADLGIKTIEAKSFAVITQTEVDAWAEAVSAVGRTTGNAVIDIWNGSIRPSFATLALVAILAEIVAASYVLSDWHQALFAAFLGLYAADRSLKSRGK